MDVDFLPSSILRSSEGLQPNTSWHSCFPRNFHRCTCISHYGIYSLAHWPVPVWCLDRLVAHNRWHRSLVSARCTHQHSPMHLVESCRRCWDWSSFFWNGVCYPGFGLQFWRGHGLCNSDVLFLSCTWNSKLISLPTKLYLFASSLNLSSIC